MATNRTHIAIALLAAAVWLAPPTLPSAQADLYYLRDGSGNVHLTNRGRRRGFKVMKRYKEFRGSSAMGLRRGPADSGRFDAEIQRIAGGYDIDPHLVKAVIRAESAFRPKVSSHAGAMGLMQLMPATAKHWGVADPWDPEQNITGGVRHLRYLLKRYDGDRRLALAAYNAGTRPVDAKMDVPNYPETQTYVKRVLKFVKGYEQQFAKATKARDVPLPDLARQATAPAEASTVDTLYGRRIVLVDSLGIGRGLQPLAMPSATLGFGVDSVLE